MEKETVEGWIKAAYENAKAHGFHDMPLPDDLYQMLIVSEIAEAIEADRKNKHADLDLFKEQYKLNGNSESLFQGLFELHIKNTFEDEIADVIIRTFDFMGVKDYKYEDFSNSIVFEKTEFYSEALRWTRIASEVFISPLGVNNLLACVFRYCKENKIPIQTYIKLKMRYNKLRPKMHGGKRY